MNTTRINESNRKQLYYLYIIIFLSIFIVYFTPGLVIKSFFVIILLFFWYSKNDFFWFALFFILIGQPGNLFHGALRIETQRLPMYSIAAGTAFSFQDLFYITAFVKAFNKRKTIKMFFSNNLNILLAYLVFLYMISIVMGMSLDTHIRTLRAFLPLTLFFVLPILLPDKNDYLKMFYLVSPVIIFIIGIQFFHLTFGYNLVSLFKTNIYSSNEISMDQSRLVRLIDAPFLNLFCFSISAFLIIEKRLESKKDFYLYLIFSLCFISIFFSATRGWIIAYSVIAILTFVTLSKNPINLIRKIIVPIIVVTIIFISNPIFQKQFKGSWARLSSMESLIKGDFTAGGTLKRIDVRSPRVMGKFKESPIIGFGFSNEYCQFADSHVGNQNILLNGGIIGYFLFLLFWINFNKKIIELQTLLPKNDPNKKAILVFVIVFIGIFIIHSSSTQIFKYAIGYNRGFFLGLFFSFAHFVYQESKEKMSIGNESESPI